MLSRIGELRDAILRLVMEAREQNPDITDEEAVVAVQVAGMALEGAVFGRGHSSGRIIGGELAADAAGVDEMGTAGMTLPQR